MRLPLAAVLLLAGVTAASADIRVDVSRYADGKTIVTGTTAPNTIVTLDGKFTTKSDGDGNFSFAAPEKPYTCMSDLTAGRDVYSAVLSGCLDPGFDGAAARPRKSAARQ